MNIYFLAFKSQYFSLSLVTVEGSYSISSCKDCIKVLGYKFLLRQHVVIKTLKS